MGLKQPLNGTLPRRAPTPFEHQQKGWERCHMTALTVSASALLATLITFVVLNVLLNDVSLPQLQEPSSRINGLPGAPLQQAAVGILQQTATHAPDIGNTSSAAKAPRPAVQPRVPPPVRPFVHLYPSLKGFYSIPANDTSPRCSQSHICDGNYSCGPDNLGCITNAKERKEHVRTAISWAWAGYRKHAWGHDEVDILSKSPHAWFHLGLTIVDSLDTLLLAGLYEEYQQARHWVANHLTFVDGSSVQFFEVNIRILGGLLSAYYLSDGDDMYLNKAEQLADRLMVAFNTTTGIPKTFVKLADASGRRTSLVSDAQTNQAEAGTISMEFTTAGRLLGRDDMFDAANHFWYVLMTSQNFSGIYCMGIHTSNGGCTDPKITIGSAADSMYEYMLKQWLLSGKTQEVPLMLYKEAMKGVREHLLRHIYDGTDNMTFVSETTADPHTGVVLAANDRFEHLTCFAGGMFVLGKLNNITTVLDGEDYDDLVLGARIGKACYELYHQAASGLAPDSVHYQQSNGQLLPPNSISKVPPPGLSPTRPARPRRKHAEAKKDQTGNRIQAIIGAAGSTVKQSSPLTSDTAHTAANGVKQPSSQHLQMQPPPAVLPGADKPKPMIHVPQSDRQPVAMSGALQQPSDGTLASAGVQKSIAAASVGSITGAGQAQHPQQLQQPEQAPVVRKLLDGPSQIAGKVVEAAESTTDLRQAGDAGVQFRSEVSSLAARKLMADSSQVLAAEAGTVQKPVAQVVAASTESVPAASDVPAPVAGQQGGESDLANDSTPDTSPLTGTVQDVPGASKPATDGNTGGDAAYIPADVPGAASGDDHEATTAASTSAETATKRAAQPQATLVQAGPSQPAAQAATAQAGQSQPASQAGAAQPAAQAAAAQAGAAQPAAQAATAQVEPSQPAAPAAAAQAASPQPLALPRPPSPSPPPPSPRHLAIPAGPVVATWSQLSHRDFLRPETIETLFYLWRASGDEVYREWGWNMFRAFERWTRLPEGGYATVDNVNSVPPQLANKMESFWLAETLKYFYLLFEDDPSVVNFDEWVLNTEAHPLPIWGSPADKKARARLARRRHAASKAKRHQEAEDAALQEMEALHTETKQARQNAPRGGPLDREGYGLAGLGME